MQIICLQEDVVNGCLQLDTRYLDLAAGVYFHCILWYANFMEVSCFLNELAALTFHG